MSHCRTLRHLLFLVSLPFITPWDAVPQTNILPITASWRYATNNLTGTDWKLSTFEDIAWPSGSALLYRTPAAQPAPTNTLLPVATNGVASPTYYFRTPLTFSGDPTNVVLTFSNLLDDGAVFYLNGAEIQRIGMNPLVAVTYSTLATRPIGNVTTYEVFNLIPTNLVVGTNLLAVEVHQSEPTSIDVVFGCSVTATVIGEGTPALVRGPYLQLGTPTSVVVRWRSSLPCDSHLVYGTNLAALNRTNTLPGFRMDHELTLSNLQAATRYYYRVGSTTLTLAGGDQDHTFLTSPPHGSSSPTRVWVTGDGGAADSNAAKVRDAYYAYAGTNHTDIWLQLGDNAYPYGTDAEYQAAVFNMYPALLRKTVTWSTIGNHETANATTSTTAYPYYAIFTLPTAAEAGGVASGTEQYYSFNYGNIHFVCLDSMTSSRATNSAMMLWLQADLQANTNQWLIAFWHHPPYSRGSHDTDQPIEVESLQIRQNFLPVLEAYGVDLVLTGHSHSYERSHLLNGHYGLSSTLQPQMILNSGGGREGANGAYAKPRGYGLPNFGTVYGVVGCSSLLGGGALNHPVMYYSSNTLGSMVLEVSGDRLDARFIRDTGPVIDWFTILKTNTAPVAEAQTLVLPGNTNSVVQLSATDLNRDPITFNLDMLPTNGLASGLDQVSGLLTYTPASNQTGGDTFTFTAFDGQSVSQPALVMVAIYVPGDTNSPPSPDVSINAAAAGGGSTLTWLAVAGVRYRVHYSDGNALGGYNGQFTPLERSAALEIAPGNPGMPVTMTFADDFTLTPFPAHGIRYYRIEIVP